MGKKGGLQTLSGGTTLWWEGEHLFIVMCRKKMGTGADCLGNGKLRKHQLDSVCFLDGE